MGGVGSIADEHEVVDGPGARDDGGELAPDAPVRAERVALELLCEETLEKGGALGLRRAVEARRAPRFVAAFDDEGRPPGLVFVGMNPPQAVFAALEIEREGGKAFRGSEPDESIGPNVLGNRQAIGQERANRAVGAVGADDQIGAGDLGERSSVRRLIPLKPCPVDRRVDPR
jgi:hypothetical protein